MDRQQHVREDRADDEVDLVAVEKPLDLGDGDVGLQLVVDDDHLGVPAAELAAELLDGEVEAVARLLAERRRRPGQGLDQPDADLVGRLREGRRRHKPEAERKGHRSARLCHASSPVIRSPAHAAPVLV